MTLRCNRTRGVFGHWRIWRCSVLKKWRRGWDVGIGIVEDGCGGVDELVCCRYLGG